MLVASALALRDAFNAFTCAACGASTEVASERRRGELERARLLAVGDSRMAVGFDTREIPDSYNDGLFGANYAQVFFRFRQAIQLAPGLDTVLVSVGPYSFFMGPDNPRGTNSAIPSLANLEDSTEFSAVFDLGTTTFAEDTEHTGDYLTPIRNWADDLFPYAGQSQLLWDRYRMPPAASAFMGYTVREVASQTAPRSGKDRAEAIFGHVDGPSIVATHFIRRLVEVADEQGLAVILVRLPVSADYAAETERYVSSAEYDTWIEGILQAHASDRVAYIDLHAELFDRRNVFQDGDHLNGSGARVATQLLRGALSDMATGQP